MHLLYLQEALLPTLKTSTSFKKEVTGYTVQTLQTRPNTCTGSGGDEVGVHLCVLTLIVTLPGNRDRSGRAVLQVCTRAQVWAGDSCTVSDLTCLLGYYYSTLR